MASSFADTEPVRDIQFYKDLAQRDLELIEDQRKEITNLKVRNNRLEQKAAQYVKAYKRKK